MNKTAIRNFSIWARVQLIEAVKQRAYEYGIMENGDIKTDASAVCELGLSFEKINQREQLIEEISRRGYVQVMEDAAYTWFNRFIALRFMEVNGLLPSKVRIFTDKDGSFKPEILKESITVEIDGLNRNKVCDLFDKQSNEELYKNLLITQCNALNKCLPYIFEKISNWMELLFPADILKTDSVVGKMISEITEDDWLEGVQIIGWMYQYYNSEIKDDTFALLKKNIKISKERIPAATQLFTPDWIVRYMVENSLGRLWYEGHPDFDKSGWKYYLEETKQEPEVEQQLKNIRKKYANINPNEIKIIDPCMGSGHILVYAFDVLLQIYTSCGWSERDAVKSIIENNLYGLDIDDRVGQLAYFAIIMKAAKYNKNILNGETRPNMFDIHDSEFMDNDFITYVAGNDSNINKELNILRTLFKDAKEFGSILNIPEMNFGAIYERIDTIKHSFEEEKNQLNYQTMAIERLLPLVKQAEIMAQKYDVVVTNPPYMGGSGMSKKLGEFVKKHYPDSKSDLFAIFIERCSDMLKKHGYQAMITQHSWMFLSSYEKLRTKLFKYIFINMIHLGARAFEDIIGEVVQTTGFVLCNNENLNYKGTYCRLTEPTTQNGKEQMFLSGENRYFSNQSDFTKIPGTPFAYWLSDKFINIFLKGTLLGNIADSKQGIATANNNKYLRLWFECNSSDIFFDCNSHEEALSDDRRWYPYNKGGEFRKWYGNDQYVINWHKDGQELRADKKAVLRNMNYYFRPCFSWSLISTSVAAFRYKPSGYLFDVAGMSCFTEKNFYYLLALCNTNIAMEILKIIAPTINFQCGDIANIPVIIKDEEKVLIEDIAKQNIDIAKQDWNSFETSWEFKKHPLI